MLQCIDHVNLVVNDLESSIEFFCALGFELVHQGDLEGDWVSRVVGLENVKARYASLALPEGETKLELLKYYTPEVLPDPEIDSANKQGFRHIAFKVSDIGVLCAKLQESGVEFLSDLQLYEPTSKKLVYFYGPERVLLELAEYGNSG
jgi:catechol 2,3-dioxygenase-like lactoylglutathione lyase family enzyme